MPYALPPKRFADPVPLPSDFRYEDREYISESKCTSDMLLSLYLIVFATDKQRGFVDAVQPKNDGQAKGPQFALLI